MDDIRNDQAKEHSDGRNSQIMAKKPLQPLSPSHLAGEGRGEGETVGVRAERAGAKGARVVTAKRPNHVWHVDLTTISTQLGMWCAWRPFALAQHWAFCWWLVQLLQSHLS